MAQGEWREPQLVELMSAATSAWLIYDITTATEVPGQAVAILQYALLAGSLIGLAGSLLMHAAQK
jgi:thiol:disulfide interchange protein